jgi:hypothetical protein
MAKLFYFSYFAISLNAGRCSTSAVIVTAGRTIAARPAATYPAGGKWTKPVGVTAEHPKRDWINAIDSASGVSGKLKKIPLWIKVPRQSKMRHHPAAGIVTPGGRFNGQPSLRRSKTVCRVFSVRRAALYAVAPANS